MQQSLKRSYKCHAKDIGFFTIYEIYRTRWRYAKVSNMEVVTSAKAL
jgi:hypothetical protein